MCPLRMSIVKLVSDFFSMPNSRWGLPSKMIWFYSFPTINVQIETPGMSNSRIFIQIFWRHFHGTLSFPNNPKFFVFTFFDLCGAHWTCLDHNVSSGKIWFNGSLRCEWNTKWNFVIVSIIISQLDSFLYLNVGDDVYDETQLFLESKKKQQHICIFGKHLSCMYLGAFSF